MLNELDDVINGKPEFTYTHWKSLYEEAYNEAYQLQIASELVGIQPMFSPTGIVFNRLGVKI